VAQLAKLTVLIRIRAGSLRRRIWRSESRVGSALEILTAPHIEEGAVFFMNVTAGISANRSWCLCSPKRRTGTEEFSLS